MSAALSRRLARVVLLEPIRGLPPAERRCIADAAERADDFSDLPEQFQQMIVEAEGERSRLLAAKGQPARA
ncbi:MAG: hypothetical protein ACRDJ9_10095 [Dehalococcoidia bacterium]